MNSKNTKNKTIKATLAVATAISAATSLPISLVQQVQAKEDTSGVNDVKEPVKKAELQKQVDEKNTEVVAASTALNAAESTRNVSKTKYDAVSKSYTDTVNKSVEAGDYVDNALVAEITARAKDVADLQQKLSDQKVQKEALDAQVQEKQAQLDAEQARLDEATKALENSKEQNKDTLTKLEEAKKTKEDSSALVETLEKQLEETKEALSIAESNLKDAQTSLEGHKAELAELLKEKDALTEKLESNQDKLAELKDALSKEYTDEEITQMESEIASLNDEMASITASIEAQDKQIADAEANVEAQTKVLDEANAEFEKATAELASITDEVSNAKDNYDVAEKNYNDLKKQVDDLEAGVDTAELTKLKGELAELQEKQTSVRKEYRDAMDAYTKAEKALQDSYLKYNDNVANFFQYVSDNTTDEAVKKDIQWAMNELKKYDGKNVPSGELDVKYYDSKNVDGTPYSLTQFAEALNYLKTANAIREKEGAKELKISYYLMAVSAIQNQVSSITHYHANMYSGEFAENLYLTSRMPDSKEFQKADGTIDIDRLESIGRGEVQPTETEAKSPFLHWWIDEKIKYESGETNFDVIGHYKNLVNGGYGITGFAANGTKNDGTYYTFNQTFAGSDSYEFHDSQGKRQYITGMSISDVEDLLTQWILYKAEQLANAPTQEEIDKLDKTFAEKNQALNNINAQVNSKQSEIDNYTDNVKAQLEEAEKTLNAATSEYGDLLVKQSEAQAKVANAEANVKTEQDKLADLNATLSSLKDEKDKLVSNQSTLKSTIDTKQTTLDAAKMSKEEVEKQIASTEAEINSLKSSLSDNELATSKENSAIDSDSATIVDLNQTTVDLNKQISATETELSGQKAILEDANNKIAAYEKTLADHAKVEADYNEAKQAVEDTQYQLGILKGEASSLATEIEQTIASEATVTVNSEKAQLAQKQWNAIKAGEATEYGQYDDETLDTLKAKVDEYTSLKSQIASLEADVATAKADLDEKEVKYQTSLVAYNTAEAEYNTAKSALDTFISTHGSVSADTIKVDEYVLYTGEEVTPEVIVKDSLGNIIGSKEYTVVYANNVELGKATVTVTMSGENYVGTFTKEFNIVKELPKDETPATPTTPSNPTNTGAQGTTDTTTGSTGTKSDKVKTGDAASVTGFSVMAALSSGMYFFLKRKKED